MPGTLHQGRVKVDWTTRINALRVVIMFFVTSGDLTADPKIAARHLANS